MHLVTDALVEAFIGAFEAEHPGAELRQRARAALEAILPMIMDPVANARAAVDVDTMVDQLSNDRYSVWIEPSTP
ncbi:MAG: hypothetical protein LWW93_02590 [Hyphomicrobiales bacterium]|nr:hypothetical protein [Hyphomicrobiales bacterium]